METETSTIVTLPEPYVVELVERPYPHVEPGSVLTEREIAAVRVDDRMYAEHMGTIDSRRKDRPGIIRMLRPAEVQRMWDVVATHEFPMTEIEEAPKIAATRLCGKILVYPHGA